MSSGQQMMIKPRKLDWGNMGQMLESFLPRPEVDVSPHVPPMFRDLVLARRDDNGNLVEVERAHIVEYSSESRHWNHSAVLSVLFKIFPREFRNPFHNYHGPEI